MASDQWGNRLGCWLLVAVATAAGLAAGPAVAASFVEIDARGPPEVWGKGAGDLDGDGLADLVVGSKTGGLFWYRNPTRAKREIDAEVRAAGEIEVADLDGVGGNDLIVPVFGGAVWFENRGRGTAWVKHTLVTGRRVHDVEVADLDGDRKLDVAVRGQYPAGDTVTFLRQVSRTSWATATLRLPETGTWILLRDLNGDRKPDLVIGRYWFDNASTAGRITFSRPITYNAAAERDAEIAAGDIDGDGRIDLFVTSPHPAFPGGGKNAWYAHPADATGRWPEQVLERYDQRVFHSAVVADLDGDGDQDLATAMTARDSKPKIKAYFNQGRGRFGAASIIADASAHELQAVRWGGRLCLFGPDYDRKPLTPIGLWQLSR